MSDKIPVLFLRLEGNIQAWGAPGCRWIFRDIRREPTLSGVVGMLSACKGLSRREAPGAFRDLNMAVRVDRAGTLFTDYHTVGAKIGVMTAGGKVKITETTGEIETLVSRRNYLSDASFLAALTGPRDALEQALRALTNPTWPPYFGRKCCPPSVPIVKKDAAIQESFATLEEALVAQPLPPQMPGFDGPVRGDELRFVLPCVPDDEGARSIADVPVSFAPPHGVYLTRYVRDKWLVVSTEAEESKFKEAGPRKMPPAYPASWPEKSRAKRAADDFACVVCGLPADSVHHLTYEHEDVPMGELRSLCNLCHDAATSLEYEAGMRLHRIDPLAPGWEKTVLDRRDAIVEHRVFLPTHIQRKSKKRRY